MKFSFLQLFLSEGAQVSEVARHVHNSSILSLTSSDPHCHMVNAHFQKKGDIKTLITWNDERVVEPAIKPMTKEMRTKN
jgi:hypothetical protein